MFTYSQSPKAIASDAPAGFYSPRTGESFASPIARTYGASDAISARECCAARKLCEAATRRALARCFALTSQGMPLTYAIAHAIGCEARHG